MEYATFVSRGRTSQLYRGIGTGGLLLGESNHRFPLHDFAVARSPVLWVCGYDIEGRYPFVERLSFPAVRCEPIAWHGGRIGGLASNGNGEEIAALELPQEVTETPRLWLWRGQSWTGVESEVLPHISSRLAWLDRRRIAFESADRRLCILDVDLQQTEVGPPGYCPAVAEETGEMYAIAEGLVARFPCVHPFDSGPGHPDGFSFRNPVTLRVTHDASVFTWTEPRFIYRSAGYLQQRGRPRVRFRELDRALGAVIGPFDSL